MFGKLNAVWQTQAQRSRARPLVEAAMAAAALVATAGGRVSIAKRYALDRQLEAEDAFRWFAVHDAVDLFLSHTEALLEGVPDARENASLAVGAIAQDSGSAEIVLRVAAAVARADGEKKPEADGLQQIARLLNRDVSTAPSRSVPRPPLIAVGNPKGGTGKSTAAVHLAVGLGRMGRSVGTIDLDGRQATFSRYLENRRNWNSAVGDILPMTDHHQLAPVADLRRDVAEARDRERFDHAVKSLASCDVIVVDTPGSDTYLGRLAHAAADILVTPINDSFLDLDVLAQVEDGGTDDLMPSAYCRMIWEQNERRTASRQRPIDWVVLRNRLAHLETRASRQLTEMLGTLAPRMGFRLARGLSERVVYRELFYHGLTVLDLPDGGEAAAANRASRDHARLEVHDLLRAIGGIPQEAAA